VVGPNPTGNLYLGTNQYDDLFSDLSIDPNTSAPWTLANLNAALTNSTQGGFGYTRTE